MKKRGYHFLYTSRKSDFIIKEGAILVSDAHYGSYRPLFKSFLEAIISKKIVTNQLILLGDIFDIQIPIKAVETVNKELIHLLNTIGKELEVIYFEGNHDVLLSKSFKNATVISYKQQPYTTSFLSQKITLAHGDWNETIGYKLYTSISRTHLFVAVLSALNRVSNNAFLEKFMYKLSQKKLCKPMPFFDDFIEQKCKDFTKQTDYFVEGHHHMEVLYHLSRFNYINIGAMACNKSYFVVQSKQNNFYLDKYSMRGDT